MSSTTSTPSAMLNWNPMDNQSIIMILPQIKDVNKVHLSEEKGYDVWMEWGKTLSLSQRLWMIQHKDEILSRMAESSIAVPIAIGAFSLTAPLPVVADVTSDAPGTPKKKSVKSCSTCSANDHTKRRCTVRCSSCNEPGHASKECPTKTDKRKADDASVDENLPKKKKAKLMVTNDGHEVPMVSQPAPTEFALILPGLVGANGLINSLTASPRSSMPTPIEHVADSEE